MAKEDGMAVDLEELHELACRGNNALVTSERDLAADVHALIARVMAASSR
jgi:hypothetical protein